MERGNLLDRAHRQWYRGTCTPCASARCPVPATAHACARVRWHSPRVGPGVLHRGPASSCWLSLRPSVHTSPQLSPRGTRGHVPSQTLPEVLVAPWVQVDQGALHHQMVPVGQGSQGGQGCPGGQRCSISMGWGAGRDPPSIFTPIPTGMPGSPFRPGSPCAPSTITLGSP